MENKFFFTTQAWGAQGLSDSSSCPFPNLYSASLAFLWTAGGLVKNKITPYLMNGRTPMKMNNDVNDVNDTNANQQPEEITLSATLYCQFLI